MFIYKPTGICCRCLLGDPSWTWGRDGTARDRDFVDRSAVGDSMKEQLSEGRAGSTAASDVAEGLGPLRGEAGDGSVLRGCGAGMGVPRTVRARSSQEEGPEGSPGTRPGGSRS